jgi:hypothetical protein
MKKIILTITILISAAALFPGSAQSNTYLKDRIFAEGLYIRNIGNFGDVWSNASGGYVGYGMAFPDHNYLMMRTGFISNKLKDEMTNEDAYLTMIPVEVGGRYYFIDHMIMPFAQFMSGLNLVFTNGDIVGENEAETLVKFAWQVGLGFTVNIISNTSVDAVVNYQSNFYDDDAMNTGFEYTVGIGYAIGN